jgi:saccharopine dehydrogenase (NAD+, L-lysine forming)
MSNLIGVIGGYGRTGAVVVRELLSTTDVEILVGGRDVERAAMTANASVERVKTKFVDVFDNKVLADFCRRCFLVVNCAGPSGVVQDRVAMSAVQHGCHYLDPGGYECLLSRLMPHNSELRRKGLIFLLSAGLFPGLTEVFPIYVDAIRSRAFPTADELSLYFGDVNEWSTVATLDQLKYLDLYGLRNIGFYKGGKWRRRSPLTGWNILRPRGQSAEQLVLLHFFPELKEFASRQQSMGVRSYLALFGIRTMLTFGYLLFFERVNEERRVRLLKRAFASDRNRTAETNLLFVVVKGRAEKHKWKLTASVTISDHYWMTGAVLATAARMIIEHRVEGKGCQFLANGVEPVRFIEELQRTGMKFDMEWDARP